MIFTLKADPYAHDVAFAIDATDAQLERYLTHVMKCGPEIIDSLRKHDQTSVERWNGRTTQFNNGAVLIRLKIKVIGATSMALLAHEVYHATCFILRGVGIPHTEDTEEAYAYLMQSLLERAYRRIGNRWWK